jgi:hypothetical protein
MKAGNPSEQDLDPDVDDGLVYRRLRWKVNPKRKKKRCNKK